MQSTVQKRVFDNYSIGLVGFIVTLIQTIILVPILLSYWGNDLYGIWIALFAGFTLLQVFDFGHQSYIGNLLNVEYHIDRKKFYNHLGSSLTIAILLGILQLTITIFLVITGYLNDFLGVSTGESNYYVISVSMLSLMLMWVIAGSIGGILIKILIPAGYMAQSITWGIIFKLSQFLSLLIVAINGGKILEASLVYSIVQLFLSYIVFKYIKNKLPEFYPWWKVRNFNTGLNNLKKSTVLTVNNAFQQFSNNGIILFITNFFSTAIVPAFTTVRTLTNTATVFTNLFITSIQPDLIKYHAKKEIEKLNSTLNANWFFSGLFVNIGLILLIPFAETIFRLWTRGLVLFDVNLFISLAASISVINFGAGLFNYLYGINHLKSISVITLARVIVLFSFSFILLDKLGLAGIGLSVLLSEIFSSLILPLFFVMRLFKSFEYKMDIKNFSLAMAPPIVLISFTILTFYCIKLNAIIILSSLFLVILIYIFNWSILDEEVKSRFIKLANYLRKKS